MKRSYQKPPVVEALCELFFDGTDWDPTIPGLYYERIRDRFPQKSQRHDVEIQVELRAGQTGTRTRSTEPRSQFSSADGSRIVQVGRDLVVVNQLRPYPHFEDWRPLVLEALSIYQELGRPSCVTRLGLRYINKIPVPESQFPMERYFNLFVEVPEALGEMHGRFLIRLEIPPRFANHQLVVTFSSAPPDKEVEQAMLLDLYDVAAVSTERSFDLVAECLDEAHANIEKAFEAIITDRSRELFEVTNGGGD